MARGRGEGRYGARAATPLQESWLQVVATLGDPVLVTDLQNNALAWNAAAEEAFGWSAAEVLAGGVSIVPRDELDAASRRLRQVMESGQPVTFESERMARDGRRVPVLATVSPLRSESGEISGLIALYKDLALSRQREAQAQTVALLEERQRIAMELHDGVMQSLYGLALSLNAAASGSSVDRRDVLRRAGREIDGIIQDVRNYIFDLRPRQLAGSGIRASLMTLAEELRVSTLIQPQVQLLAGVEEALSEEAGTHLVHVAREATSNIIRHSHATSAYIQLARNQRGLRLVIRDNGLGFDAADTGRRLGDGTRIMKERAMAMGADLQINSAPGEGTTIALDIPLAQGETERQQTRVLLVDDHELVRRGLHELFESCSDIEVTAAVASADEAVESARRLPPDVVVMDVHLADHAAIAACRVIRADHPQSKVVMIASYTDEDAVMASVMAGASGYVLKQSDSSRLLESVRSVARGASLLDDVISTTVVDFVRSGGRGSNPLTSLTQHERDILRLIAMGRTNREIAKALALSEHTIRTYVSRLFHKLNITHRAEAAAYVVRHLEPNRFESE